MIYKQGILGASKKRPLFYVEYDEKKCTYAIFLGFIKILSIPNDKNSMLFKTAIALLLGAHVATAHIQRELGVSLPTIRKIRRAFQLNDEEKIIQQLKSPGRIPYKMTKEIEEFIYERYGYYQGNGKKYYYKKIGSDILKEFNISLCPIKIKQELLKINIQKEIKPTKDSIKKTALNKDVQIFSDGNPHVFSCLYAGALLVSQSMSILMKDFPEVLIQHFYSMKKVIIAWIIMMVVGLKNLEALRHIRKNDFAYICGENKPVSVDTMRIVVKELSIIEDTQISSDLLNKNVQYFINQTKGDYYIDGHLKEYSGEAKVLSAWNTKKNRVTKGVFHYCIHDKDGNPIYAEILDNFYDFREIIPGMEKRIEEIHGKGKQTLIFDRGGFAFKVLQEISSIDKHYYITWQKNFKIQEADNSLFIKKVEIFYPYNTIGKFRTYKIDYYEDEYQRKEFKSRRIIIRRQGNKKKITQSILTSDKQTDAGDIIIKILKRFSQENDFKKQRTHYGLDEIITYDKLEYNALGDKNIEKMTITKEYKKLSKKLEEMKEYRESLYQSLGSLVIVKEGDNSKGAEKKIEKVKKEIQLINKKIQIVRQKFNNCEKQIPKITYLKNNDFVELDLRKKRIVEMLNISARNIVEREADEFLNVYKNLRDYQKLFHRLINTRGEIEICGQTAIVKLERFGGKAFQQICEKYFEKVNVKKMKTPDGFHILQFEWEPI